MIKLFSEFDSTTSAQWKEQLVKDLKGIDYNTLVWKTNSGIEVQPFYTNENLKSIPSPIFTSQDWSICESVFVNDEKEANSKALNALQNGASGLIFHIHSKKNYDVLLKDISLEHIYTLFKVSEEQLTNVSFYLSNQLIGNSCYIECDQILNSIIKSDSKTLSIDTSIYQEAGANTINELAFSIAHLNEYLNHTKDISDVHISISIGGDFFMEIAKVRALRKLIDFILKQYQLKATIHIHAQTTSINKSTIDSYTNMLRSTTEAMSAAIGGANSIIVLPFDETFNDSNDFSSRMARNQQLILKDESYLNVVADMASGSYYIENLTETLCEKAWEQFKLIESKGGLIECLNSGYIQNIITSDAENLMANYKEGKLVLVGVNKFQNKNEEGSSDFRPIMLERYHNTFGITPINISQSFQTQKAI